MTRQPLDFHSDARPVRVRGTHQPPAATTLFAAFLHSGPSNRIRPSETDSTAAAAPQPTFTQLLSRSELGTTPASGSLQQTASNVGEGWPQDRFLYTPDGSTPLRSSFLTTPQDSPQGPVRHMDSAASDETSVEQVRPSIALIGNVQVVDGCANQQLPVRRVPPGRVRRANSLIHGCQGDLQAQTSGNRAATLLPPRHAMSGGLGLDTGCMSTQQLIPQHMANQAAVLATPQLGGMDVSNTDHETRRLPRRKLHEPVRDPSKPRYPCRLCTAPPKTFARPSALKVHMLTHTHAQREPHFSSVRF
jgi:hypothetical protein